MNKAIFIILLSTTSFFGFGQNVKKAETVTIDGNNIYYEVYGEGEPLFLLHAYTLSSKDWIPYVPDFEQDYEVYLIDLPGHGRSDAFSKDWSVNNSAQILNGLVEYLDLEQIRAIGFSYGADVIFQLATINSKLFKSIITIGAVGTWDAKDFPDWVEYLSLANIENLTGINAFQNDDKHINAMLNHFINYRVIISDEQLTKIESDVLLIFGDDDDSMPLEEVARFRKNLSNSDLWILPNSPHDAHKSNKGEFIRVSKEFLKDE
jgi:pimeloyl-ACP methyl ester carboxylesterase